MNIFALDECPIKSANFHCDQHLNKMILESAQMLSTAAAKFFPEAPSSIFYKPSYPHHPCTIWCCESITNCLWVIELCWELETIRLDQGMNEHSSMEVIHAFENWADHDQLTVPRPAYFALAMPAFIKLRTSLNPHQKYQLYYQHKHRQWIKKGGRNKHGMTYNGRSIPEFMSSLVKA